MKIEAIQEGFFPELLKSLPIWVLWRLEERKGHMTKVPYRGDGTQRADSTDPGTWTDFDTVSATLARCPDRFNGKGIVMSKEHKLIFIDIDHCIDQEGNTDCRGEDILDAFRGDDGSLTQFIELSQSGSGVHIICQGDIPRSFKNSKLNVEMYSENRFCAMTGRALSALDPSPDPDAVAYVFDRYKTAKKDSEAPLRPPVDRATQRTDDWIIHHAMSRTNSKFPELWSGDYSGYASRSEADLALCKLLAFWTDNDPEAIDRLFRRSGLNRAKWEVRSNYRNPTIRKAIADNDDTLSEFMQRKEQAKAVKALAILTNSGY